MRRKKRNTEILIEASLTSQSHGTDVKDWRRSHPVVGKSGIGPDQFVGRGGPNESVANIDSNSSKSSNSNSFTVYCFTFLATTTIATATAIATVPCRSNSKKATVKACKSNSNSNRNSTLQKHVSPKSGRQP